MESKKTLSPQESLKIISDMIASVKKDVKEDGHIYILWGVVALVASLGQFILIQNGNLTYHWLPYLLNIPMSIYTAYYYSRKGRSKKGSNHIATIISSIWICVAVNIFVSAFGLPNIFQDLISFVILILLGLGLTVSGTVIKESVLRIAGIFTFCLAYTSLFLDYQYHPLLMAGCALFGMLIPGLILRNKFRQANV